MGFFHKTKNCKACKKTVSVSADSCPHCGVSKPGKPCFVATATYGSEIAPEVLLLRQYRDKILLHNLPGKIFVGLYYKFSPQMASFLENKVFLKQTSKRILDAFIKAFVKDSLQKKGKDFPEEK